MKSFIIILAIICSVSVAGATPEEKAEICSLDKALKNAAANGTNSSVTTIKSKTTDSYFKKSSEPQATQYNVILTPKNPIEIPSEKSCAVVTSNCTICRGANVATNKLIIKSPFEIKRLDLPKDPHAHDSRVPVEYHLSNQQILKCDIPKDKQDNPVTYLTYSTYFDVEVPCLSIKENSETKQLQPKLNTGGGAQ